MTQQGMGDFVDRGHQQSFYSALLLRCQGAEPISLIGQLQPGDILKFLAKCADSGADIQCAQGLLDRKSVV